MLFSSIDRKRAKHDLPFRGAMFSWIAAVLEEKRAK